MEHAIVGKWDIWPVLEGDTEFILEASGLQDDNDEGDGGQSKVQAVSDSVSKDLSEIPAIQSRQW